MEEQEKKETLSRLYTLRAGLSAIALEKDKADEIFDGFEEKKTPLENQVKEKNKQIQDYKSSIRNEQESIKVRKSIIDEIEAKKRKSEKAMNGYKNALDEEKKIKTIMIIFMLLSMAIFASGLVIMIGFMSQVEFYIWIILLLVGGIPGFTLIAVLKSKRKEIENYEMKYNAESRKWHGFNAESKDTQKYIYVFEENCRTFGEWIEDNEKEIQKLNESIEEQTLNQKSNDQIKYHVKTGEVLYDGLQQEFNALLDHRDWENLDYVIYALETGRADSMKEALQLVDRERQTDRIVKAVKEASNAICGTLADGFARLGQLVAMCSEQLTLRVKELSNQMSFANQQIGAQTAQLSNLKTYLASLTDQVSLGNALQSKANESSLKLVDEIHEMKNHSDYADWRLRKESM